MRPWRADRRGVWRQTYDEAGSDIAALAWADHRGAVWLAWSSDREDAPLREGTGRAATVQRARDAADAWLSRAGSP